MDFGSYTDIENNWPKLGKHILASYDQDTIFVYQAYNKKIAEAIVKNKSLHHQECIENGFNLNRMTWVKTNFLWMMYRSGWATKKDQERIIAIRLKKSGFDEILSKSKSSSNLKNEENQEEFKNKIKSSNVVLQWDPDHFPDGTKAIRRAIQLGIRGEMLLKFSKEFIVDVIDLTQFVNEQFSKISNPSNSVQSYKDLMIPCEKIYVPEKSEIVELINLTLLDS